MDGTFSIRYLGKVVFSPTSTPTKTRMPIKKARIFLSFNSANVDLKEVTSIFFSLSGICVAQSHIPASRVMTPNTGRTYFHPRVDPANHAAMLGPDHDERALTN